MADFPVSIILQLVNKLTGPAREAARGLDAIGKELKETTQEAAKATAGTKKVAEGLKQSAKEAKDAARGFDNVNDQLKVTGDRARDANGKFTKVGQGFKETAHEAKKAADGAKKFGDSLKTVTQRAREMRASLDGAYSRIQSGAGLATTGVLGLTRKFIALKAAVTGAATAIAVPAWGVGLEFQESVDQLVGRGMSEERARKRTFGNHELDLWSTNYSFKDFKEVDDLAAKKGIRALSAEQKKTLANFSTASGVMSIQRVTEMLMDAGMGQVRPLKDFGIKVDTIGKGKNQKLSFSGPGIDKPLVVLAKDQEGIIKALLKVMAARGGTAEAAQGDTIKGRLDALGDAWRDFLLQIAVDPKDPNKGLFPFLKKQLFEFTDWLDKKQKDGTIGQWAQMVSDQTIKIITGVTEMAKAMPDFTKSMTDLAPVLKDMDIGQIALLAGGLYMLPDGVRLGAGLTQIGGGLLEITAALKGVSKAEAFGSLVGIGIGILGISFALQQLDKYRDTFRKFMEDLSGSSIEAKNNLTVTGNYGDMSGQAFRNWVARKSEFMREYYRVTDEMQGHFYDPTLGKMVKGRGFDEKLLGGLMTSAQSTLETIKSIYKFFSGNMGWTELKLKISVEIPELFEKLFPYLSTASDLGVKAAEKTKKALGMEGGAAEPPAAGKGYNEQGRSQKPLQGVYDTRNAKPLGGVYAPQKPLISEDGVTPFIRSMKEAQSLWGEAYREKQAEVNSNVPAVFKVVQDLFSLWTRDWGVKKLQIIQPSVTQPFGNNGLMPPRPPSQSGTMTDKVGWNRLPPGGSTTNSNNTTTVNVAVHVKGGADAATAERVASAAAAKVRTALRGGLYDGSVPQVI